MRKLGIAILTVTSVLCLHRSAAAGTQDFTLVNRTGVPIHNLYISESDRSEWEEDVLGKDVLENGDSVDVAFSGKKACLWDMMVKDQAGDSVAWESIDLCELSRVVLHCDSKQCWASGE